jgi:predicted site-specific integrase-resolvase
MFNQNYLSTSGIQSKWMNRKQASQYANVSIDTIDDWCKQGHIIKIKNNSARNGKVLILVKSIDEYMFGLSKYGETRK